jgi:all-trans-retinol dehydrogenase (NAD+)
MEPQAVVDGIAEQIFKCAGGQVFLPPRVKTISALRGLPNWLQEMVRGDVAKVVLPATS